MSLQNKPPSTPPSAASSDGGVQAQKRQPLIILVSLIAGVFGAVWILLHSPYAAKVMLSPPPQTEMASRVYPYMMGEQGGRRGRFRGAREIRDYTFVKQSLFVANLTCSVGDYVVSVRRVHNSIYSFDSNPEAAGSIQSEPFIVSLQVMSMHPDSMKQIDSMSEDFSITDNGGNRYLPTSLLTETDFPGGRGCIFQFPAIPATADCLRSVDGMLRLSPSAGTATSRILPFHITNVPLPWKQHVFGVVGAALLDADVASTLQLPAFSRGDERLEWVTGKKMEAVLERLPQEAFLSPDLPKQPERVVLTQNVPNTVRLPLVAVDNSRTDPASTLSCTLAPHLLTDGEMTLRLSLKGENQKMVLTECSVWSNTPQMLIMPARRMLSGGPVSTVLVFYLHLYLDNVLVDNPQISPLPRSLRAKQGERGGALAGRVSAGIGSLGAGDVQLAVLPLTATGVATGKPETITTPLDAQGNFVLSNLSPGHYRVTLLETKPVISPVAVHTTFARYLARRCGITHPIVDQATQELTVRPGDQTELLPWVYKQQK